VKERIVNILISIVVTRKDEDEFSDTFVGSFDSSDIPDYTFNSFDLELTSVTNEHIKLTAHLRVRLCCYDDHSHQHDNL
jgi:hypothetical protein